MPSGTIFLAFLNGYSPGWADTLRRGVARALPQRVDRLDVELDLELSYAPDRRQYHATLILAGLLRHLPRPEAKIVGITSLDLFIPVLTFVFGQSQLDGSGALISTHRLENTFYGLPGDEDLLIERTIKEAVHELGHAFGLVHCPNYLCVMSASTSVAEVDLKGETYCSRCADLLRGVVR